MLCLALGLGYGLSLGYGMAYGLAITYTVQTRPTLQATDLHYNHDLCCGPIPGARVINSPPKSTRSAYGYTIARIYHRSRTTCMIHGSLTIPERNLRNVCIHVHGPNLQTTQTQNFQT